MVLVDENVFFDFFIRISGDINKSSRECKSKQSIVCNASISIIKGVMRC